MHIELYTEALQHYAEQHTAPESPVLAALNRETHAKVLKSRMLSGHLQGKLLTMLSAMIQPKVVLEIGTFTGYSAICMAEGMPSGSKLITLDVNEELENLVRGYISKAGYEDRIDYRIGNAMNIIPTLEERFDLVFIDADKENYANYFDLVIDKVNLNGFILADNVLWSGKVLNERPDKDTLAIRNFNKKVHDDPRVDNVLLPVRDGIMILRKVSS